MTTFSNENILPHLPVPELRATSRQLLASLKPLISSEEYLDLELQAVKFEDNGFINNLQQHLKAASKKKSCYLNVTENANIYGELRGDILPRNPFLVLEDDPYAKTLLPPDQPTRAASLINSALKFIINLRLDILNPDLTPVNGNPLTMNWYNNLFGASRVPNADHSEISVKRTANHNDSRHLLILSKNQYYVLEVLTPEDPVHQIWFNDLELAKILAAIIDNSTENTDNIELTKNSIGAITTEAKKSWKLGRLELAKANPKNLALIDSALFVVSLDPSTPTTDKEKAAIINHGSSILSKNIQIGSCTSRWYDKLQLVVTRNSVAGIVWESTSMDSTAILRFISDIYTDSVLKLARKVNGIEYSLFKEISFCQDSEKPDFRKLDFVLTDELLHLVHLSETRLADLINQHEFQTLDYKINNTLIDKLQISKDSLIQIGFQIAHYALYGRLVNTLEPITTRYFKDARTELIPVQNDEVLKLVRLFITDTPEELRWEKLVEVCKKHSVQYKDAMKGKGFERHLNVLFKMYDYRDEINKLNPELPPIATLEDEDIKNLPLLSNGSVANFSVPEMLISNCGNPALHLFGISPAIPQGYGIGYIIKSDSVSIVACSKFRQTERLLTTFKWIMNEIKQMMRSKRNLLLMSVDSSQKERELLEKDSPERLSPHKFDHDGIHTPIRSFKAKKMTPTDSQSTNYSATTANDFILGGYGYFDVGELEVRSDQLSMMSSKIHSTAGSRPLSRARSRLNFGTDSHSQLDLNAINQKMSTFAKADVGRQLDLSY